MKSDLALHGGKPIRTAGWPQWPQNSPELWESKIEPALRQVYLSGSEGLPGRQAKRFAQAFADFCGAAYGVMTPHGTDALMAALTGALDLDGFDGAGEIILPNYTFIATASAALDRRLSLCFVDVQPDTFTLCPEAAEAAIDPERTRAVLPVHLGGHPADMERIVQLAERHGLKTIEDCAQAHGAEMNGRKVGSMGDAGAFSFQSSKNLTAGEGGMVVANDEAIRNRVAAFKDVGRHPDGERWEYPRIGWNYRPSEYLAALLSVRLETLEAETRLRNENAAYLTRQLTDVGGLTPPRLAPYASVHGFHLYMCQYDADAFGGRSRAEFCAALRAEGIPCSAGYTEPLSESPALKRLRERRPDLIRVEPCPNVEKAAADSVWLMQNMLLAEQKDMDDIAEAVAKIRKAFR